MKALNKITPIRVVSDIFEMGKEYTILETTQTLLRTVEHPTVWTQQKFFKLHHN